MDQAGRKLLSKIVKIIDGNTTLVVIPPRNADLGSFVAADSRAQGMRTGLWSVPEHNRFLQGVTMFPHGPWDRIAAYVGTRTTKQTRAHAQKYVQKIERHLRGLLRGTSYPMPAGSSDRTESPTEAAVVTPAVTTTTTAAEASDYWDTELEELLNRYSDSDLADLTPDDVDGATSAFSHDRDGGPVGSFEYEPLPISEDERQWDLDEDLACVLWDIGA